MGVTNGLKIWHRVAGVGSLSVLAASRVGVLGHHSFSSAKSAKPCSQVWCVGISVFLIIVGIGGRFNFCSKSHFCRDSCYSQYKIQYMNLKALGPWGQVVGLLCPESIGITM